MGRNGWEARVTAIRLLVLGTIRRRGIAHGYRVYRDLTSWRVETWTSVKPGSIYHAIAQLESQGFILPTDSSQGAKLGPSRTEYQLTSQGEEEFTSLLETAIKAIDIEILAAGIAFMEMLPRDRVIALLNERLTSLQAIPLFLKTLPTEPIPSEPSKHPELIGLWVGYVESAITSTQNLIKSLENGKYAFLNEKEMNEWKKHHPKQR
jgi:DNA-binding PadR family transcriptional regulator